MTRPPHQIFDRGLLLSRRARFAAGAGSRDFLLHRAAEDIAERLSLVKREFPDGAVIGAYHGVLARRLRLLPNIGRLVDVEASPALAALCDGPTVVADEEALPFAASSLDLVVSALSLQLVNDLPGTLAQVQRALKPDGLMLASLLGGLSLHELRLAFVTAEAELQGGASPRVAPFADVRDLGGLLQRAGFALPVADADTIEVAYASALELMRDLQGMASANPLHDRSRTPMSRGVLMRAAEIYAERFARADGRVIATFEIVTLTGWAPHPSQQQPLRPGSAKARLADALGVPERGGGAREPKS